MRINVYSQELTKEVKLVGTKADTGVMYYGVRLYLASPDLLHHTEDDDDRSAITFWIPNVKSYSPRDFAVVLHHMAQLVEQVTEEIQPNE